MRNSLPSDASLQHVRLGEPTATRNEPYRVCLMAKTVAEA